MRGIREKFSTNLLGTGTGSMTNRNFASPGRSGFASQLSLSYEDERVSGMQEWEFEFGGLVSKKARSSTIQSNDRRQPMRDIQGPYEFTPSDERTAHKLICDEGLWPYFIEHPPDEVVRMHYHETDETLYLLKGDMSFIDGAGNKFLVRRGQKLVIPEGVLHSVAMGQEGAAYIMGLKQRIPLDSFPVFLPDNRPELAKLLEINYDSSDWENVADDDARCSFKRLLSKDFMFVAANGDCLDKGDDKTGFIGSRAKGGDRKSRHVELKTWPGYEDLVFASLFVEMGGKTYLNMRAFQKEQDQQWRCVRWSNVEVKHRS
jgi:mannose-6-phosphate isomerase-like protein (cupin superfamily)